MNWMIVIGTLVGAWVGFLVGHRKGFLEGFSKGWFAHKDQENTAMLDTLLHGTAFVTESPDLYRKTHSVEP